MIHIIAEPIKTAISAMTLFTDGTDTRIAGVVTPVTKKDKDGNKFTFPASCDVDGKACYEQGRYFDLLPNDLYRAVIYFEQRTDVRFTGYKPPKDKVMIYETDLRLVGWINAKKLGSTDCSITSRIVLEIIKTLTTTQGELEKTSGRLTVADAAFINAVVDVLPVSQVRQDQSIFSRYTLKETVLLYPWDYFAIDLRCALYVGRECFDAVTAGEEIVC